MTPPAWRQLILATGHGRGGTTWLGAVLAEAEEAEYIFEPQLVNDHPPTSHGEVVDAFNRLPRWYLPAGEDLSRFREALLGHLGELVQSYFGRDHVDTLVIKIPEAERLPWLIENLDVDRVIYIQRHPLGIVNSYDEARAFWVIRERWDAMEQDLAAQFPELAACARAAAGSDQERTAAMAHIRYALLERFLGGSRSYVAAYETLALEPLPEFEKLFDWLGWRWDDALVSRLRPYFAPRVEKRGMLEVQKTSAKRIFAWRRELAPWHIRRIARLFAAVGADYPMPGAGLPPLSANEQLAGIASFAERRARRAHRWLQGRLFGTAGS